jgi:hypothetical protein
LIKNGLEDCDHDGLLDRWEDRFDSLNLRSDQDPDGDGVPNVDESQADTDPTDPDFLLSMTPPTVSTGAMNVRWRGGVWSEQVLEECDLTQPSMDWRAVFTNPVPTAINVSHTLTNGLSAAAYRIRAIRP